MTLLFPYQNYMEGEISIERKTMLFLLRGGGIIEILGNRNIEKYIHYSPY